MAKITIRHAHIDDCQALSRVLMAATEDTFRGRVPDQCIDWLTPEISAANWAKNFKTDQSLTGDNYLYVADTATDGVVGLAMLTRITDQASDEDDPFRGYSFELRSLQVHPAWQRQGVGHRLVVRVADKLRQMGIARLLVKVLVDNPNQGFYERLGAVRLGIRPFDWEGYQTEEILYGWEELPK